MTARDRFPVDLTLRLAGLIRAHAREVVAFAQLGSRPAVRRTRAIRRQPLDRPLVSDKRESVGDNLFVSLPAKRRAGKRTAKYNVSLRIRRERALGNRIRTRAALPAAICIHLPVRHRPSPALARERHNAVSLIGS